MREAEVKLAAPATFRLPDLAVDGTRTEPSEPQRFTTTYYDTPDLRLARWGGSLRYRDGEKWTVKLPSASVGPLLVRMEHRFDGPADRPPAAALDLLRGYLRSAQVSRVARLRTARSPITVGDGEGRELAQVVDDEVSVLDGRRVAARFREVEVELREGDLALADAIADRLREAGAGDPDPTPKLVRAIGGLASAAPEVDPPVLGTAPTAGEMIRKALASSVTRLIRFDAIARLGEDLEGVHQTRVATRRLRSDLRTFRGLLEPEWTAGLRDALRRLGSTLGAVRDLDVLADNLRRWSAELAEEDARAAAEVVATVEARGSDARDAMLAAMREPAYDELLERLVTAAASPPVLPEAGAPARLAIEPLVEHAWSRLRRLVKSLPDRPSDEELHRVRIHAKRARYAAEAAEPAIPELRGFARAAGKLQDVLGTHQDGVIAAAWLRDESRTLSPRRAFAAGELAAVARAETAAARTDFPDAWKRVRRRRPSGWS